MITFTVRLKLGATFHYDFKENQIAFTSNGIEERIEPEVFTGTVDQIIDKSLASRTTKLKLAIASTLGRVLIWYLVFKRLWYPAGTD